MEGEGVRVDLNRRGRVEGTFRETEHRGRGGRASEFPLDMSIWGTLKGVYGHRLLGGPGSKGSRLADVGSSTGYGDVVTEAPSKYQFVKDQRNN